MPRIVSVDDETFTLPPVVKVANANLPAALQPTALSATYLPRTEYTPGGGGTEEAKLTLLAHASKARTGPLRILTTGTSIGAGKNSPLQFLVEQLKAIYGDSGHRALNLGVAGGSYENAVNGWKKQPYGGTSQFTRMRGDTTSTPYTTQTFNCDEIAIYWSRETDGQPFGVDIDGVAYGTVGAGGAQKYGEKTVLIPLLGVPVLTLGATATTGGTFAAATYYWKVTAYNSVGETVGSNEVTSAVAVNGTQVLSWPAVPHAVGYKVYRGTVAGSENVLVTTTAKLTYTDTGTAGTAGAPPASGTVRAPGAHNVTLKPPTTNYAYPERIEFYNAARKGVEFIFGALGGSSINSMVSLRAPMGAQVAGIPISGNVGLDSFFNNPEFDAILWSGPVNDAGAGLSWINGGYVTATDYAAEKTRANGVPVLGVIEMGGHYLDPAIPAERDSYVAAKSRMLALGQKPNFTIVDWDTPTAMADLAAYGARYYNLASDFIHPTDYGYEVAQKLVAQRLALPAADTFVTAALLDGRMSTLPAGYGSDKTVTIDAANVYFPVASRLGAQFIAQGESGGAHIRPVPVYRYPTATVSGDTTSRRNEIAASVTSTEYGKYLDMTNKTMGLSFFADYAGGEKVWLTIIASGTINIRVNGASTNSPRAYVDGVAVSPAADTLFYYITAGATPVTLTVQVGASGASGSCYITGRVYDVAMTKSSVPVLI